MATTTWATKVATGRVRWQATADRATVLAEEARCRHAAGAAADPEWLRTAAAWLAEVTPEWTTLTGAVPARRTWRRLVVGPDLDARLMCWPAGCSLGFHDHGGAAGAVHVLGAGLVEAFAASSGQPADRRLLDVHQTIAFDAEYVHAMANRGSRPVTTVNLYAPAPPVGCRYRLDPEGMIVPVGARPAKPPMV